MKTPVTENALSLGTDVGEIFIKALSKQSRFPKLRKLLLNCCNWKYDKSAT